MADINVLFKRGMQKSLDAAQTIEGAFYLTKDTHRLYVGQDGQKVLLNQTVSFVESVQKLNDLAEDWRKAGTEADHVQDIYYVVPGNDPNAENTHKGNILAVYCKTGNSYAWMQINPDTNTHVRDLSTSAAAKAGGNGVVITTSAEMNNETVHAGNLTIAGDGKTVNITFANDGDGKNPVVTIKGDTYTLSAADNKINLGSALGQAGSSVEFVAGANVSLETANNKITVKAKDTVNTEANLTLGANGVLTMGVTDNGENTVSDSATLSVKYGANKNQTGYVGGTLDVYTIGEVDSKIEDKFKNLNGLTYIGTVGVENGHGAFVLDDYVVYNGSNKLDVHVGDMFLVADAVDYASKKTAKAGDLLIATGTENASGVLTTITWTYVPSGDDVEIDTTYSFTANAAENTLTVKSQNADNIEDVGAIQVKGSKDQANKDNLIVVTSEAQGTKNEKLAVTVKHGEVTFSSNANPADADHLVNLNTTASVDVITGVTVTKEGHVSGLVKNRLIAPRYELSEGVSIADASTGTTSSGVNVKLGLHVQDGSDVFQAVGYTLKSENLKIKSETANTIEINYIWSEF